VITSLFFDRIKYRKPELDNKGKDIPSLLGLDTEADETGRPFLLCLSDGKHYTDFKEIPFLLLEKYAGYHIAVYNLKYESGAILYYLPPDTLHELWLKTEAAIEREGKKIKFTYIPHKMLSIETGRGKGRKAVKIWDICQYYAMSLNKASQIYLGKQKIDIETKKFTKEYREKNFSQILKYCIQDAVLCAELGNFLIHKLKEFGIRTTALYSSASLSFRYYADRTNIVTSWRLWQNHKKLLKMGIDSYQGGKFEITARGAFKGYEYDITSAYPYEIMNLADISFARIEYSRNVPTDAYYGFIRCKVFNPSGLYIPCGIMADNVRVYPSGEIYTTITLSEYKYMTEDLRLDIEIIEGAFLILKNIKFPYKTVTEELFALKAKYKVQGDKMLTNVSKLMLNSFYGKTVQMIENWEGFFNAGAGWNPLYGSIITANCRIKVCRIQNLLKKKCLAVHTDSVITLEPLPPEMLKGGIGEFEFVEEGEGLLVACGQYCIGEKEAYKGFDPLPGDNWRKLLQENSKKTSFEYPIIRVNSWVDRVAKGYFEGFNLFEDTFKVIDLNVDRKRIWKPGITGSYLLNNLEYGLPRIFVDTEPPEYWKDDYARPV